MRILSVLTTVCLLAPNIRGEEFIVPNQTTLWGDTIIPNHLSKRGFANNMQLRIMPLGASIVYGQGSTDRNGFRYGLRNKLVWGGNPVNMVGSRQSGLMADNDVEGWPGDIITGVAEKAKLTYPQKPNIVLIHVGTNDMTGNNDVANAHTRLGKLIDDTFAAIPGVTIIASTLLPNAFAQGNVRIYNGNIPAMIRARQSAGKKVTYVDFSSSWFSLADIGDGTHPTDNGYLKMAAVWYQGIEVAANAGWLSTPAAGVNDVVIGGSTCWKVPGNAIGPVKTQQGSGFDDGAYRHVGTHVGGFHGFNNPAPIDFNNPFQEGVYWADINGDGIDDYVYVAANANLGFGVALSTGNGGLGTYLYFPFSGYCLRRGVRWADMTGDGRDDLCCLYPSGDLECWQNTPGGDARRPNFVHLGIVKKNEGYPQAQIRLADIDGDGRADYVCFSASGTEIWGWRNGAQDKVAPAYWYPMRGVASGLPSREMSGWKFADLNGDKRDDLVWVDASNGKVFTWINKRGYKLGLTPVWENMGNTHLGFSGPTYVTFGAFMGSGRADYSAITIDSTTKNVFVDRWRNDDSGGRMVKGDGVRYCDMTGSGKDDYLWILSTGEITLFGNEGNWGYWRQWGVIYNANRARREIHIADYDGDGKCDILLVDKGSGATTVIKNEFANDKFAWTNLGVVTAGASCGEGYGYDMHDNGVRWHDLDGDGRADFICMHMNGYTTAWLNRGLRNMQNYGQVKKTEGRERKNLRFADIDGDGRVDLVWLDMITGKALGWRNMGVLPNGELAAGSTFLWEYRDTIATGNIARGSAIEFGKLYGLHRADYIAIDPQVNSANTWFNVCPDGGINPVAPNLPTGAPAPPAIGDDTGGGGGDGGGGGGGGGTGTYPKCDKRYYTLEEIENDKANIADHCMNLYIAMVLRDIGRKGISDYENILKNDYKHKFEVYSSYMEIIAPDLVEDYMWTNASKHFTCWESRKATCCQGCTSQTDCAGCEGPATCGRYIEYKMDKCPTRKPDDDWNSGRPNEVRYELTGKLEDLQDALSTWKGVAPDWWVITKLYVWVYKYGNGGAPSTCCVTCTTKDPSCVLYYYGFPVVKNQLEIADPQDDLGEAIPRIKTFLDNLDKAITQLYDQTYVGNTADVPDASLFPVNLLTQGVDSLNAIVEASSEIEEILKKERENLILLFVTFLIGFVPFAGIAVRAAGLATVGRMVIFVGETAQVALNLYSFQGDPSNPANLLWVVIDLVSVVTPNFAKAAASANTLRTVYKFAGFNPVELARAARIDRIKISNFRFIT